MCTLYLACERVLDASLVPNDIIRSLHGVMISPYKPSGIYGGLPFTNQLNKAEYMY